MNEIRLDNLIHEESLYSFGISNTYHYEDEVRIPNRMLIYSTAKSESGFVNEGVKVPKSMSLMNVKCSSDCHCAGFTPNEKDGSKSPMASSRLNCEFIDTPVPRPNDPHHRCVIEFSIKSSWLSVMGKSVFCHSRPFVRGYDTDRPGIDVIVPMLPPPRVTPKYVLVPNVGTPEFDKVSQVIHGHWYRFVCSEECQCHLRLDEEKEKSLENVVVDCPMEPSTHRQGLKKCTVTVNHWLLSLYHQNKPLTDYVCTSRFTTKSDGGKAYKTRNLYSTPVDVILHVREKSKAEPVRPSIVPRVVATSTVNSDDEVVTPLLELPPLRRGSVPAPLSFGSGSSYESFSSHGSDDESPSPRSKAEKMVPTLHELKTHRRMFDAKRLKKTSKGSDSEDGKSVEA